MPATPSSSLLTRKAGPLPVWAWGLGGLGGAYAIARYRANKTAAAAATTTGTGAAGEPATGAPEYIIENNLPSYAAPSAPVVTPVAAPPAVTPPGTAPQPPTNIHGGHPPVSVHPPGPEPMPKPAPAPAKKAPAKYKVVAGDTLTSIAARHKTTAAALYTYNTTPGVRSAADIATIKRRGPDLIYPGETILIPQ